MATRTGREARGGDGRGRRELLPRLLSKWHVASRKEAERLVVAGRVAVNERVCRDVLRSVDPGRDRIDVDGRRVGPPSQATGKTWIALNKPRGVVTTTRDPEGRPIVMDLVADVSVPGLAPVGRLDRASAGLLLLTDDHALADRLLDPATAVPRTYRVGVRGPVDDALLDRLRQPATLADVRYGPFTVEPESATPTGAWLAITLSEGKNREIRRRLTAEGLEVRHLIRVAFGPVTLADLAPGTSRRLTAAEVAALTRAVRRAP